MELKNYRLYVNYGNVGNPYTVRKALKYYYMYLKYSYLLKNTWTGFGPRRIKLKRIIKKAEKLASYYAAKSAGLGNNYKLAEGKIGCDSVLFLQIFDN